MNVLNVRYDVYGGVPDDLVRSSITISRRFGTLPLLFRTARRLYRIYGPNRTIPNGRLQADSFF
jgi:hypothetical protein